MGLRPILLSVSGLSSLIHLSKAALCSLWWELVLAGTGPFDGQREGCQAFIATQRQEN